MSALAWITVAFAAWLALNAVLFLLSHRRAGLRFRGTRPSDWMELHLIDTTATAGRRKWHK